MAKFIITFADASEEDASEDADQLFCPFCSPESGIIPLDVLRDESDSVAHQVINEHYHPGLPDDTLPLPACSKWLSWKSATWELHDRNVTPSLRYAGEVIVVKPSRTIEVVTTFPSRS
jgi:hypothetical protein